MRGLALLLLVACVLAAACVQHASAVTLATPQLNTHARRLTQLVSVKNQPTPVADSAADPAAVEPPTETPAAAAATSTDEDTIPSGAAPEEATTVSPKLLPAVIEAEPAAAVAEVEVETTESKDEKTKPVEPVLAAPAAESVVITPAVTAILAKKAEAVNAVVAVLNSGNLKADDKETDGKFRPINVQPRGGVRLVKDLLTGRLKALPKLLPQGPQPSNKAATTVSAIVAATMAGGKDGQASAAGAVNLPVGANAGNHHRAGAKRDFMMRGMNRGHGANMQARDARPMHLHLGSRMATPDVVADGTLSASFNISSSSPKADVAASLVPTSQGYSDFFLWRTFVEGDRPKRAIMGQMPFVVVNSSDVVSVKVTGWNARLMTPIPVADHLIENATIIIDPKSKRPQKKHELLFSLQYECHAAGRSLVTVIVRMFEMTTGQRATESLTWSFIKECSKPGQQGGPEETNTQGNSALPGLYIGTRKNGSDVVSHGEAQKLWTLSGDAAATTEAGADLFSYGVDIEGTKFWMRYEPPVESTTLQVNKHMLLIDDPQVLMVEGSGDLAEQVSLLRADRTFTLSLTFICKKEGSSTVTVAFNFPSVDQGKVSFSFRKECAGLVVSDGATMNGVDIWLGEEQANPRKPEVVSNGVVQPEWRPIQNLSLEAEVVRTASADDNTPYISFFVKLRRDYHPVEYDSPVVESYSASGDVILRPTIGGSIQEASKLVMRQSRFLVLSFNCIRDGEAVVTVKLPFRPSGAIQFNIRKTCALDTVKKEEDAAKVTEYSTGDELMPLPGINVGHFIDTDSVVTNGIPTNAYHLTGTSDELMPLTKNFQWVNFFLWKNSSYSGAKDVRFGRPELISTADIARPVISGLGAEGGLIADNEYSTVSVTFHCFTEGNTTITLIIPLVGDEWLNAKNEPVSIKPARADPIKISFVKECPAAVEEPVIGMGGIGISGFAIGFAANTSELVLNGFPQPHYFGQRNKPKPDWDEALVAAGTESTTVFLHYGDGLENKLVGKEVVFQAPVVVSQNPTARPALAGAAAVGGVLVRDGPALPLDLTYNCRYSGLAVVTIVVPIVPHGQISITIPKLCDGDAPPHGVKVSGLHVGTTPTGSEVVQDGQTTASYVAYSTKKYQEHKVFPEEITTTFYLRKTGEPIRAIEPLIYAHRPIVNMRLSHAMRINSTLVDDEIDGDEIEINDEVSAINITYACVHDGKTDVTISLNLLPKGQVQWTFEKHCMDYDPTESLGPLVDGGTTPGGIGLVDDYLRVNRLTEPDLENDEHARFGAGTNQWDADAEWDPNDNRQGEFALPLSASIASTESDRIGGWGDLENPHGAFDHTVAEGRSRFTQAGLSSFQVGTGKTGADAMDVFTRSMPTVRYMQKNKAASALDNTQYAVVKPDQLESTFYFSSTAKTSLAYGQPQFDKKAFTPFLKPQLSGDGAVGGELVVAGEPRKLVVTYNCLQGGVFAVGLRVPVGDGWALFRVIKICPSRALKDQAWHWTAGRALAAMAFVAFLITLAAGFIAAKRIFQQRKTLGDALYVPVATVGEEMH